MATEPRLNDYLISAYHSVMRDGTVAGLLREMIKDVRNTFMEVFFSKGERGGEAGAPLNPLYFDQVQSRKLHDAAQLSNIGAMTMQDGMPTPSELIANPAAYLPSQPEQAQPANVMQQEGGSLPSPSEIIANPAAYQPPEPQMQQDHSMSM